MVIIRKKGYRNLLLIIDGITQVVVQIHIKTEPYRNKSASSSYARVSAGNLNLCFEVFKFGIALDIFLLDKP